MPKQAAHFNDILLHTTKQAQAFLDTRDFTTNPLIHLLELNSLCYLKFHTIKMPQILILRVTQM